MRREQLLRGLVVCWLTFLGLAVAVDQWHLNPVDEAVRGAIDSITVGSGDHGVTYVLAHIGASEVLIPVALVTGVVWSLRSRTVVPAGMVIGGFFLTALVVTAAKGGVARPEPGELHGAVSRSYPSGHVASAAAVWGGLALTWRLLTPRRARRLPAGAAAALVAVVVLMMLWRDAHWLTDIVGGLAAAGGVLCAIALVVTAVAPDGRGWWAWPWDALARRRGGPAGARAPAGPDGAGSAEAASSLTRPGPR